MSCPMLHHVVSTTYMHHHIITQNSKQHSLSLTNLFAIYELGISPFLPVTTFTTKPWQTKIATTPCIKEDEKQTIITMHLDKRYGSCSYNTLLYFGLQFLGFMLWPNSFLLN